MFKKKKPYESRTRADKYLIFKNLIILLGFIILLALMVINGIIFFVNAPVNETILPVDTNNLFVWTFIFLLIYSFLITFLFLINLFKLSRERKYLGCMVDSIVDFAESKDNFTAEHHRKVAQIAKGIAKKMNLSGERIKIIYKAGLIHDIGKINIPERTLNKSTKLIDSELEIIKTHPVIGYNILCNIRNLSPIDIIILQHHERINGTGYPYGLTGKKIILEAKIIAVADVIEAMSSERPYGSSIEIRKILNEIQDNSGILYDEKVVDACLDLFSDGEFQL